MSGSTIVLHRIYTASPEKLYRAFKEPVALASWLPPNGFTCKVLHQDFRVGGNYKMAFTNFTTGNSHSFGGEYLEILPNERIQYTDQFDDPTLPGQMTTTITLKKVLCGTELTATQSGIPSSIPVEMCYLGWQESLEKLKRLVEPNIPD